MQLSIDIGNTLIDFGVYEGKKILRHYRIISSLRKSKDQYESEFKLFLLTEGLKKEDFLKCIISSVVPPLSDIFIHIIKNILGINPYILGPGLKSGLVLQVDNPKEVGADLVADTLGVLTKYGGDAFVADLGTANKYIYINKQGAFAGLSIAPGLRISLNALVNGASALTSISIKKPASPIGKNTMDCMNSGIVYGTIYEIEGFASSFEKEIGHPLRKILTGGNALFVKDSLPGFIYDETLLLDGLNDLLERLK